MKPFSVTFQGSQIFHCEEREREGTESGQSFVRNRSFQTPIDKNRSSQYSTGGGDAFLGGLMKNTGKHVRTFEKTITSML